YVAQQGWIMNATLQENILFGKPLEEEFYKETLRVCALEADLDMLPAGDQTEIGERGINLSCGQKARPALGRAVYARSRVYLLDDPLSAVDAHVGRHLFEQVIGPQGILRHSTRILVTHAVHMVHECDQLVVLDDGEIVEQGTFDSLMEQKQVLCTLIRESN